MRPHRIVLAALLFVGVLLIPNRRSLSDERFSRKAGHTSGHPSWGPYPAFLGIDASGIVRDYWAFETERAYRSRPSRASYTVVEIRGGRPVDAWSYGNPFAWGPGSYVLRRPNGIGLPGVPYLDPAPWQPFGQPEFPIEPVPPAAPEPVPTPSPGQ